MKEGSKYEKKNTDCDQIDHFIDHLEWLLLLLLLMMMINRSKRPRSEEQMVQEEEIEEDRIDEKPWPQAKVTIRGLRDEIEDPIILENPTHEPVDQDLQETLLLRFESMHAEAFDHRG
jgi:hypothetical protein